MLSDGKNTIHEKFLRKKERELEEEEREMREEKVRDWVYKPYFYFSC